MGSHRELLRRVEVALQAKDLQPRLHAEIMRDLRRARSQFEHLLEFPPKSEQDRKLVQSKQVYINQVLIPLEDIDVQLAVQLSEQFNLNELQCVELLNATDQEWGLENRDPQEVLQLAGGIFLQERQSLLSSQLLEFDVHPELLEDVRDYITVLLQAGTLVGRIISLIKDLGREGPNGLGSPGELVKDWRCQLVYRADLVQKERRMLCECLFYICELLPVLHIPLSKENLQALHNLVRDLSADWKRANDLTRFQIASVALYAFISAVCPRVPDGSNGFAGAASDLAGNAAFVKEFTQQVMASAPIADEGFMAAAQWAWGVFLAANKPASIGVDEAQMLLRSAIERDAFGFLAHKSLGSQPFADDHYYHRALYSNAVHRVLCCFLSDPIGKEQVKQIKDVASSTESEYSAPANSLGTALAALLELVQPELQLQWRELPLFVEYVGQGHRSHTTLVPYLHLLAALASDEDGARAVFMQMLRHGRDPGAVSWEALFRTLQLYNDMFAASEQERAEGTLQSPPRMPREDVVSLQAYLQVLQTVFDNATAADKQQWYHELTTTHKLQPLETIFLLLGYSIPGALRETIAAFAFAPELAERIWTLMEEIGTLQDFNGNGGTSAPPASQYDAITELNEVESREEQYPATLGLIKLLNALQKLQRPLATSTHMQRDAKYFHFVRDHVFIYFAQRQYKVPSQKWEVATACLEYFLGLLQNTATSMTAAKDTEQNTISTGGAQQATPPHAELMQNILGESALYQTVIFILAPGADRAMPDRAEQSYGFLEECSVLLSLQLLLVVLQRDQSFVHDIRLSKAGVIPQTLDQVLVRNQKLLVLLLDYVNYEYNAAIQRYSIQLFSDLATRIDRIVPMIVEAGAQDRIKQGYAARLAESAHNTVSASDSLADSVPSYSLIFQLLLSNLQRPQPNAAHLLLGYDCSGRPIEQSQLDPRGDYNCLKIILKFIEDMEAPEINATLFELCFRLLYQLNADSVTSNPTCNLLTSREFDLFTQQISVLCSEPLPEHAEPEWRISSLHQRAWLLEIATIALHVADLDIKSQRNRCMRLLQVLFVQPASDTLAVVPSDFTTNGYTSMRTRPLVLELLDLMKQLLIEPASTASPEAERLRKEMREAKRLESVLGSAAPGNQSRLHALREAVQSAVEDAVVQNQREEELAGRQHLLEGWQQIIEVSLARCSDLISEVGGQAALLFQLVDASLDLITSSMVTSKMRVSLSQVVLTGMAKLQEQQLAASPGDTDYVTYLDLVKPAAQLPVMQCVSLFRHLVDALTYADSTEAVRRRLYGALLTYAQYCQATAYRDVPAEVLNILLSDSSIQEEREDILAQVDKEATALQVANADLIRSSCSNILAVVARDAVGASEVVRTLAHYAAEGLLNMDRYQVLPGAMQRKGLLHAILSDLSSTPAQTILLPSLQSLRRLYTSQAQVTLLLSIAQLQQKTVNGINGSELLLSEGVLMHLISCRALDVAVEGDDEDLGISGMSLRTSAAVSQAHRYHMLLAPVLRLINNVLAALPDNLAIRQQVMDFMGAHDRVMSRILSDRGALAKEEDLENIKLVTGILARIAGKGRQEMELKHRKDMFTLMRRHFGLNDRSKSKYLRELTRLQESQTAEHGTRVALEALRSGLLKLRCNLAEYLRTLVVHHQLVLPVTTTSQSRMTPEAATEEPTLQLLGDMLQQTAHELSTMVEERAQLLSSLKGINQLSPDEIDAQIESVAMAEHAALQQHSYRHRRRFALLELSRAVKQKSGELADTIYLVEHMLDVLYYHLARQAGTSQQPAYARHQATPGSRRPTNSSDEWHRLRRLLTPVLEHLLKLDREQLGRAVDYLQQMARRLKEQFSLLSDHPQLQS
eukprot:jgi/Chlat1/5563/Chrsp369S05402